jgi:hypothetical protein
MKNRKLLLGLLFILSAALFFGCNQSTGVDQAAEKAAIGANPFPAGNWKGTSYDEAFVITDKYLTYTVQGSVVYAGPIEAIADDFDDDDSGIIYIQYVIAPYGIPGNYYAVRWERFEAGGKAVWLSGCSDADGKDNLTDAEIEYSEANKDKYFAYGSDFVRAGKGNAPPKYPGEKPPYLKYLEEKTGLIIVK